MEFMNVSLAIIAKNIVFLPIIVKDLRHDLIFAAYKLGSVYSTDSIGMLKHTAYNINQCY